LGRIDFEFQNVAQKGKEDQKRDETLQRVGDSLVKSRPRWRSGAIGNNARTQAHLANVRSIPLSYPFLILQEAGAGAKTTGREYRTERGGKTKIFHKMWSYASLQVCTHQIHTCA
jgi:hypothetical protein